MLYEKKRCWMAKIAVVTLAAHGHVNPTLALAEELGRRGHEVTYWVSDDFREAVAAAGVKFASIDSLIAKAERPKKLDTKMVLEMMAPRFLGEAQHVLPQLARGFADNRPDIILYDHMCIAARILAEAEKIPSCGLFTSYAANEDFNILSQLGEPPAPTMATYNSMMAEICKEYGTRPFPFTDLFGHGENLNIVFMPKMWQPKGDFFDERYVFVGPCLGTRPPNHDFPAEILSKRPLLFISLGTAFNENPDFYLSCFEAFGGSHWNVVMAVGVKTDLSLLKNQPANFTVRSQVPQLEVLQSTDVFLTHGGMNSTMEGLSQGVPLVAIPQMFEQAVTARRIAELGVGISLADAELSTQLLRQSVEQVWGDTSTRRRASEVQKAIKNAGGVRLAGDVIEGYL
jgi:MGT family glycosyltransferase